MLHEDYGERMVLSSASVCLLRLKSTKRRQGERKKVSFSTPIMKLIFKDSQRTEVMVVCTRSSI